jgi:Uma2 family endonuclease/Flp pilus assembly protein TadD
MSLDLLEPPEIKPDKDDAFYNRGNLLFKLGRYEEAIDSYDKALAIQLDFYEAWYNRSIALRKLERNEEALANYDKVLEIEPDDYWTWFNRGSTLLKLGRYQEAIASYDKALEINSDFPIAWYIRGRVLFYNLELYTEAINSFDKALKIELNNPAAWADRGLALYYLRQYEEAIASFNKAVEFTQNDDKALAVVPNIADTFYNKACCYAMQGNVEQVIETLQQAINLSPDKCREVAKTDSAFDSIREDERFQALIQEESDREEGEIDDREWLRAAATNPAFEFLNSPEEDIYTLDDSETVATQGASGKPFNPEEEQPTQAEILSDIRRERSFNPAEFGLPDSLTLLREARDRWEEGETKIFHNISWEEFENILAELGDNRSSRLAYDRGTLEIMTPLPEHEGYKEIIGDLIKDLAEELSLDYRSFGSTTWKRQKKLAGAEPDNCFYIQNEHLVRGRLNIDLSQDPPPDLVLEIDITSKSLDRMPIYARLGVSELWRYDKKVLHIYQLQAGKYNETDSSLAFGTFPVKEIPNFIERHLSASTRALRHSFRAWVRQYLAETSQENDWEDGEIDEREWLRSAASNPAFDFLKDPEEDIYTLADGKPFHDER